MNGFIIIKDLKIEKEKYKEYNIIEKTDYTIIYKFLEKFQNDKIYFEHGDLLYLFDGILFNKSELLIKYGVKELKELIIKLYRNDINFYNEFRGSFRGFIVDIKNDNIHAYTNHTGEKEVYYYNKENIVLVSTEYKKIIETLLKNNIKYTTDIDSCYSLLTNGYLLEDNTICNEIKKLEGGTYYLYKNDKIEIYRYHKFNNIENYDLSEDEIVDGLEKIFKIVVKRMLEKNKEYNYNVLADLSAGIDSRTINFAINNLDYENILNICYCQSKNIDATVAKKISKDLGNRFYFYKLDDGNFIYDLEEMIEKYNGHEVFYCSTGANRVFKELMNKDKNIGLSIMGTLGEILKGDCSSYNHNELPNKDNTIIRSSQYIKHDEEKYYTKYENLEMFNLYNYGLNFIVCQPIIRMCVTEVGMPFIDTDFLQYCLNIPLKFRKKSYIYKKWIHKYYKKSEKYIWQTEMKALNKKFSFIPYYYKFTSKIKVLCNRIFKLLRIKKLFVDKKNMNPFEIWLYNNKELKDFLNNCYNEGIENIENKKLREDTKELYKNGTNRDKLIAINLIETLKEYKMR